ncbi:MAG: hypothetical protein HYU84_06115 [Chloroflexi bacterium]|nr:hypothetical protein [Chloroflexota bacterium]
MNQLAKVASQFLREQVEDNPEVSPDEESETESFFKKGIIVLPTYAKVSLGEEKKFWVYVNKDVIKGDPVGTVVSCDNEIIEPLDQIIQLQQHSKKENSFVGTFKVRAKKLTDSCVIQLKSKAFPLGEAIVEVVEPGLEIRDFISPLEFEHKSYSVEEGKSRILHLYAKYPEVISKSTSIKAWTTDDTNVAVRGSVTLDPVIGSNYARGDIRVEGRRIDSSAEIKAAVNGREAQATVKVKSKITKTVEMEIRIEDEDFGNFRARWADHDGKPNLLLISAKHESVRRYLGPPPEYAGQEGPIFRLLLAEIVAESVCRKVLGLEAKNKPWEFALRDLMSDQAIVDEVFSKLHRRFREFVGLAHRVMVGDIEISSS